MIKDNIICGNCVEILKNLPSKSVDMIFADPPYFMQTDGELLRNNGEIFSGVSDEWDKFDSFSHYDEFCEAWLKECKRILKDNATIWVIGSFQNIFRIGCIVQNLGFWILNDIIWAKTNPVPNFKGTRFCNAHETLLWCVKNKNAKFTFNYKTMKHLNGGKQDKSVWNIGLCIGNERLKGENGKKLHSTQKPETLLEKIVLSSTKFGDLVLDPFFGTGTTGAVAKKFGRHFIGIEQNMAYVKAANERISKVKADLNDISLGNLEVKPPKVSLNELRNAGFFKENEPFYDKFGKFIGNLTGDKIDNGCEILSIHKMAAKILERKNYNGWSYFYIKNSGKLISIDSLRYKFKEMNL